MIRFALFRQTGFIKAGGDNPAPADYDGDDKTGIAVYRGGAGYLLRSAPGFGSIRFGPAENVPQPEDCDGDGRTGISVFRQGVRYYPRGSESAVVRQFGLSGDIAILAAFNP